MMTDHAAFIRDKRADLLFAGSELAAVIEMVQRHTDLLIHSVAVAPTFQKRGFGRRLIEHAEGLAADAGLGIVRLYTNALFHENLRFYASLGYHTEREEPLNGGVAVHMVKHITRTSRCACGECMVEVTGDALRSGICNCDDCRRRTGAPFGWSVYFENHQIRRVTGPFSHRHVESGKSPHIRHFCSECGSTLYWDAGSMKGFAGGCFNDPTLLAPRKAVRCANRLPWAVFPTTCEIED